VSRYQKGKTNLDLLKQETVSGSGIGWAICNHASTPPVSFLQAGRPSCRPTNSVKALKAKHNNNNRQHCHMTNYQPGLDGQHQRGQDSPWKSQSE